MPQQCLILGCGVGEFGNGLTWDDEYVGRSLGVDISNHYAMVILVEEFGWDLAPRNFAKYGIGHFSDSVQLLIGRHRARLFLQHHGNTVAHGVCEPTRLTLELLLVLVKDQGRLTDRAD